ncbi:MAG: inositol monophosphatase family protein [Pirellulaceae bacterium]
MNCATFQLPEELDACLEGRLAAAIDLAVAGGRSTLEHFQSAGVEVIRKGDDSPVTIADRNAEQLIRDKLASSFADDSILGEEFGEQAGSSGFQWIVDPIDGTKSFISGVPLYSTLVAVLQDQVCLGGVIYIPALDEIVFATKGKGAWHSVRGSAPQQCRVSSRSLEDGLFLVSQVDTFQKRNAEHCYLELEKQAYITRSWGDGYGYLLIATGRAELMVDPIANSWDLAAVQIVVEEAGGRFTSWKGAPTVFDGDGVGSNGTNHEMAVNMLKAV